MVKHIIIWKLNDNFSNEEKQRIMEDAKKELEALKDKIDGLLDIKLQIEKLDSSNGDMLLDSSFVNRDALKGYIIHPAHVAAAENFIKPFTSTRLCIDFEV